MENLQPKLRFPEFKEKINFDLFKNYFDLISGYAFKSDYFNDKGIDLIIPKNFSKNGYGNFNENINKKTSENVDEKFTATQDDLLILLTDLTPSCELLGNPLYIKKNKLHYVNQRISKVIVTNDLDKNYLKYVLLTRRYKTHIVETATGTTVRHSSNKAVLNYKFIIPTLQEQTKIADFLGAVDKQLDILNQKKEKLNHYKKGVMQQLFAQQIRFKDDNGNNYPDWQEKSLGEVGEIVTGKTPSTKENIFWNGEYLFVTPTDLNENKKFLNNTSRTINDNFKIKKLPSNIIAYTCIASIGKMNIITKPCITNQQINSILVKNNNTEYIYYYLKFITPKIISTVSGNTMPIINKTDFSKITIQVCSIEEQNKIANFLSAIDTQIEAVENQITKTETYKKGLLQQMFV